MIKNVMLALDGMDKDEVFNRLENSFQSISIIKIGLELYTRYGNDLLHEIYKRFNKEIFLDLKLHDIPNTVNGAIKSLQDLPIKYLTIHLSGGKDMLKQALQQAKISLPNTKILGVSILTSINSHDLKNLWNIEKDKTDQIYENYFNLALDSNIHGIVLSPNELKILNKLDQEHKLLRVCPGIRFVGDSKNDQKRTSSPKETLENGCDLLVIGRSLTNADSSELLKKLNYLRNL